MEKQRVEKIYSDYIDLTEIFNIIWLQKKILAIAIIASALLSVIYSLTLTNYYKSEAIFSVTSENNKPSNVGGSVGAIASLAGINLGSPGTEDKASLIIETIKSRAFLEHILTFDEVLPGMMAAESYNPITLTLSYDQRSYDSKNKVWVRNVSTPFKKKPSVIETHMKYISEILTIQQDRKTGFIYMSVEHISPVFAKELLDLIFQQANALLSKKDMEEAANSLEYLQSESSQNLVKEMRSSISQLMLSQLEIQMLTKVRKDYALRVIDPPYVPELKSKPSRATICVLGTILGTFLSLIMVLLIHYYQPTALNKNT